MQRKIVHNILLDISRFGIDTLLNKAEKTFIGENKNDYTFEPSTKYLVKKLLGRIILQTLVTTGTKLNISLPSWAKKYENTILDIVQFGINRYVDQYVNNLEETFKNK